MIGNVRIHLKRLAGGIRFLAAAALPLLCFHAVADQRLTLNFNPDWRFIKADPPGAAQTDFDDHAWDRVSTPHTYNDVDTFDDWSLPGHRGEQDQWGGRTWYRKTFTLPASARGKKIFVEFEAVRQVAEVYLNGHLLGTCKTGFTPFGFDLTPYLHDEGTNVIAVMCDNRFMKDPPAGRNGADSPGGEDGATLSLAKLSARVNEGIPEDVNAIAADQIPWNNPHWHPAHGGIYRNVRLHVTDPLHISLPLYSFLRTVGPYVYATDISPEAATVHLEVPIENGRASRQNAELKVEVVDARGKRVLELKRAAELAAGATETFTLSGTLKEPQLWEPGYPCLYRVVCTLNVGGKEVDNCELPLGIRTVRWDTHTGFYINGRHLKLRGWGQKPTDEWPGLGAAQPDWLHFFTLNLMAEAGGNWVRWGHCLGGPAQIEACDRLGLGVEQPGVDGESDTRGAAWTLRAEAFRDTIIYFRNHPSILVWEGGNQKVSVDHARQLRAYMDEFDSHGGRAYAHRRADEAMAGSLDVGIGTEGGREIARLPVVEGEYDREESPRRVWDVESPPTFGYPEAKGETYDLTSEQYAVNQVSQFVRKLGALDHCGGANWIFSDSTSGGRVRCEVARASGEVDGVRLPKEAYYVCQAMFRPDPRVHVIGHWTYPAGTKKTVYVVSNCERVELLVNGSSLGRIAPANRYLFAFTNVLWKAGEIKAVAFNAGKAVATDIRRTAGEPAALRLTAITGPGGVQADGSDVALIDVEAVDARGERCPTLQQRVDFETEGPGTWLGGYNSGKIDSIRHPYLDLECGVNRVAIRAGRTAGTIRVTARSKDLRPATITIRTGTFEVVGGLATKPPQMPDVRLPAQRPIEVARIDAIPEPRPPPHAQSDAGLYAKTFSYTGPTTIVHVEHDARPGKNIYVDRDFPMGKLPSELEGADWVQAAEGDNQYNAADLMEITVRDGTVVTVAHDSHLPRPGWLSRLFKPVNLEITINGHSMNLFQRRIDREESLTLGPNVDAPDAPVCNMYVVFVSGAKKASRNAQAEYAH